jgi:wobble nucleotide-excising tRNase
MVRRGEEPFLECSSKGDKRFSTFFAYIKRRNDTIENIYQSSKVFDDGVTGLDPKSCKQYQKLHSIINMKECTTLYKQLWLEYLQENPLLLDELTKYSGLSDIFGKEGNNCQATVLWEFRNRWLEHKGVG